MKSRFNNRLNQFKRQCVRGFTLIELVVVVAIVGLLIALVAPNVAGSRDGTSAALLTRAAQNISANWSLIAQSCGTSTDVATSPVPGTAGAANVVKLLLGGTNTSNNGIAVGTGFANCYAQSRVLPISEMAQYDSAWKIGGYALTLSGGGTSPLSVTFAGVPDSIVTLVASKFNPSVALANTADSVAGMVSWTASTTGSRDLTIIRQIN